MDIILDAIAAVAMVLGSLLAASLLCGAAWAGCARLGCPYLSALLIGLLIGFALLIRFHSPFVTLLLIFCMASMPALWIAGRTAPIAGRGDTAKKGRKKLSTGTGS
jgi:hypothetical protein